MTHNSIAYYEAKLNEARNLEAARHNREAEASERRAQAITKAYNDYYLQIADFREHEQQRHNMASERLNSLANTISLMQVRNDEARIKESQRHNVISERNELLNSLMHNTREREKNAEVARHNLSMEGLQQQELDWQKTKDKWNLAFTGISTATKVVDSGTKRLDALTRGIGTLQKLFSITN